MNSQIIICLKKKLFLVDFGHDENISPLNMWGALNMSLINF